MSCLAIVVNYFSASDTGGAVESLLTDNCDLTVVVVDNSCDRSESDSLKKVLPPEAKIMTSHINLGFGQACNWAAREHPADYIFLLNPDARVLPGCTSLLIDQLKSSIELGAVAPMQYLDDQRQWMLPPSWFPTEIRAWATDKALRDTRDSQRYSVASRNEAIRYWTSELPVPQRALSGGMLMIRQSAVESYPELFDPQFFMYFEDSDLCQRLRRRGYKLAMVPKAIGVHRWNNHPHKGHLMAESAAKYFRKYASNGLRIQREHAKLLLKPVVPLAIDYAQAFPRDGLQCLHSRRLLELSTSRTFNPAIARLSNKGHFDYPHEVLGNFQGATLFSRVGSVDALLQGDNWEYFKISKN